MTSNTRITTVRGLDKDLYSRMVTIARSLGRTTGELVNEAMKLYLAIVEGSETALKRSVEVLNSVSQAFREGLKEAELLWIKNINEVELSKQDIERYDKKIVIYNVKKVIVGDDIDENTFNKYIYKIISCEEIIIPRHISKITVYSKCQFVGRIEYS